MISPWETYAPPTVHQKCQQFLGFGVVDQQRLTADEHLEETECAYINITVPALII